MKARSLLAFSLIEVVIALGIISFVLAAVLGLLGVGLFSSRQSSEDTSLAAMTSQVLGQLSTATSPTNASFFFDMDGLPLTNSSGAVYRCVASTTLPSAGEIPNLSTNFLKALIVFTWPVSAAIPPHTNTFNASLLLP